ncbi:MAG: fumarate reductase cytochrome b subunit [Campylobacterales bacterium]|nr:fumarate reductase cytochrome b subunit [Campylobacterales bacterium]
MGKKEIDKIPAKLDFMQSLTGLILGVFIMGHILFESSILISKEFMYKVTIMFEGYYFFGETYPGIISFLASAIFIIFIIHASIAIRKFPASYKQCKIMKQHTRGMKHEDTSLWMIQIATGFLMFFLGSIHLYMMIVEPSNIGPYASSNRVVNEYAGVLYILLLLSVVSHAFVGLYRLVLKWGFFEGKNTKVSRARYKVILKVFVALYITLGLASLAKYTYIGLTHDFDEEPRYKSQTIILENHK